MQKYARHNGGLSHGGRSMSYNIRIIVLKQFRVDDVGAIDMCGLQSFD